MKNQALNGKFWTVIVLIAAFTLFNSTAYAWSGNQGNRHSNYRGASSNDRVTHSSDSDWIIGGAVLAVLAIGLIAAANQPSYETVYVSRAPAPVAVPYGHDRGRLPGHRNRR